MSETTSLENDKWLDAAVCGQWDAKGPRVDPECFFDTEQTKKAQQTCYSCPAIGHCALYALETNQEYGVWGSLTRRTRGRVNRRAWFALAQQLQTEYNNSHPNGPRLPDIVHNSYGQ